MRRVEVFRKGCCWWHDPIVEPYVAIGIVDQLSDALPFLADSGPASLLINEIHRQRWPREAAW
jgi:hypothetical protein